MAVGPGISVEARSATILELWRRRIQVPAPSVGGGRNGQAFVSLLSCSLRIHLPQVLPPPPPNRRSRCLAASARSTTARCWASAPSCLKTTPAS